MNLLIVDDEYYSVELLKGILDWKEMGFREVYTAYSMLQAQDILRSSSVDIMLCDIEMPRGSGLDLLEWIRAQKFRIECIFLTCHAKFDYAQSAIKLDSVDYILKPVEEDHLRDAISRAIHRLNRVALVEEGDVSSPEEGNAVVRAKKYIADHLQEDLSRSDIAAAVYLNSDYLSHLFHEKTGLSLSAYIQQLRMEKAIRLLTQSNESVTRIASMCGFSNIPYFSRQFKTYTGKTPNEYRKNR